MIASSGCGRSAGWPVSIGSPLTDETRTFSRMAEVAAELRDQDGADVLIMGCAGMARYRDRLQRHVGLPVVEPSQAAVSMAIGRSRLHW